MHAATEFGLFKKRTLPKPLSSTVASVNNPDNKPAYSEANKPLQKLAFLIQKKILSAFPGETFSRELLKKFKTNNIQEQEVASDPKYQKIKALFSLFESVEKLAECLLHEDNYRLFFRNRCVQGLRNPMFKASVENLKSELDNAIAVSPVDAEQLRPFEQRAVDTRNTLQVFQTYVAEFKEKRLYSGDTNRSVFAEIDRRASELIEDIKQHIETYLEDIPFFESCLKLLLNDYDGQMKVDSQPFMNYTSSPAGWFKTQVEYQNVSFNEEVLKERLSCLCTALHREYARAAIEFDKKITNFSKNKQSMVEEIDARLNILKAFPIAPEHSEASTCGL